MFVCTPIELTLMIWPDWRSRITGSSFRISRTGAEVVELHRPLEVVGAVVGERDRAPDRAAGVVDQDVDVAVLLEHLLGHPVDVVDVGEVAAVDVGDAAAGLDLLAASPRASPGVRATSRTMPPASAIFIAADLPMPEEAPVTMTISAAHRLLERDVALQPAARRASTSSGICCSRICARPPTSPSAAAGRADQRPVAEQVRVEVALPVVPELARVGLERRHA